MWQEFPGKVISVISKAFWVSLCPGHVQGLGPAQPSSSTGKPIEKLRNALKTAGNRGKSLFGQKVVGVPIFFTAGKVVAYKYSCYI